MGRRIPPSSGVGKAALVPLDMVTIQWYNSVMKSEQEIRITVRFPAALIEALRPLAKQEDRSLNGEIVQAVREYVKRKQQRSG
jgi:hypothetical protein